MAISQTQMAEVARILGFPNLSPQTSLNMEYPTFSSQFAVFQPYAQLLNRLAGASDADEVQYFGAESTKFASFFTPSQIVLTFSGPGPTTGVIIRINLGGNQYEYTVNDSDTYASIAAAFSASLADDPQGSALFLPNAVGPALGLYNVAAVGTDGNGVQCMAGSTDTSVLVSFGGAAAQFAAGATSGGQVPPGPQFTAITGAQKGQVVFGFVPIIHLLESDLVNARANLDTLSAEAWHPRQDELDVRKALLDKYRIDLANGLAVPIDPDIMGNNSRGSQRIV